MATKDTKTTAKPAAAGKAAAKPGTAVATRAQHNVVDIQETLRKQAAAMADRTAPPSGSKIKVPQGGGQFQLPNGQVVQGTLEAVIVDFRTTHSFFPGKFDKNNIRPPVCFAVGVNPKAMAPVDESPDKQADDCQGCPNNVFGSDGDGKACKNGRRLAILPLHDDDESLADVEHDMWVLDVSPTAIKGFDGFVQAVARTFQMPPAGVAVTIGFDQTVDFAKLTFSNPRPITNVGDVLAKQEEAAAMLEAKPDFSQLNAANDAKARTPARKAAGARR